MRPAVGLIGCGRWGMNHLKTLHELKKSGIIGSIHACDLKPDKQHEVTEYADTFHTDWQTLVQQHQLDLVAIVTPADTHCNLALSLLDHCHSLFIEKPIGLSQREASAIISKVQDVGGRLLVGHILRFHEAIKQTMTLISDGSIGELHRVEFNRITTREPPDYPNIFEAMAIHGIDTACYAFGELEPSRLSVENLLLDGQKYPTNAELFIEFPGMKEAHISVGWNGDFENRSIEFIGSKGNISVETDNTTRVVKKIENISHEVMLKETSSPLLKEWVYLIEMVNKPVNDSIYPLPGAVIRSIKWLEMANQEISNGSVRLNESIE